MNFLHNMCISFHLISQPSVNQPWFMRFNWRYCSNSEQLVIYFSYYTSTQNQKWHFKIGKVNSLKLLIRDFFFNSSSSSFKNMCNLGYQLDNLPRACQFLSCLIDNSMTHCNFIYNVWKLLLIWTLECECYLQNMHFGEALVTMKLYSENGLENKIVEIFNFS